MANDTSRPNSHTGWSSDWRPSHNPWMIAFAVMLSTFMEVLDTSVANVALPHIAGNLSASTHEATWVLTSYLVSNAIILPATAWLGGFFGRKRFLILCVIMFTLASALCGFANSLGFLITARILQGIGGGALQPISQAVLLESFPKERRGEAMAVFALGVIVAPIIGPTLGGWITDNFSWRWIFFINIPVGILAVFMSNAFVEDPPYLKKNKVSDIDYIGFSLMALGLALLQIILDKGQEVDWFETAWLSWAAIIMVISLVSFVIWELRVKHPVVDLRILKDINFTTGTILMTAIGAVLYSSTALLPLYLQNLMHYSAYLSGLVLSPRGIAAFCVALIIGKIIRFVDGRLLIAFGLTVLTLSCVMLSHINLNISFDNIVIAIIINGIGMSAIFVPLSTLTMGTLHSEEVGNATGLFNLMRNVGGSIGIAATTTMLARFAQVHQNMLVAHLTPYDPSYQMYISKAQNLFSATGSVTKQALAQAMIYTQLLQQSTLMAFVDNFQWLAVGCAACIPLVFLFKKVQSGKTVVMH